MVRVERQTGRRFAEVCQDCAKQLMSRKEAALHLRVNATTFRLAVNLYAGQVVWPAKGQSRKEKAAERKVPTRRHKRKFEHGVPTTFYTEAELWELAKQHRLSYHIVWQRYQAGLREAALVAPVRTDEWEKPSYVVGFTVKMWESVLSLVGPYSEVEVAKMKEVPLGAVLAMLNGEEELVG